MILQAHLHWDFQPLLNVLNHKCPCESLLVMLFLKVVFVGDQGSEFRIGTRWQLHHSNLFFASSGVHMAWPNGTEDGNAQTIEIQLLCLRYSLLS